MQLSYGSYWDRQEKKNTKSQLSKKAPTYPWEDTPGTPKYRYEKNPHKQVVEGLGYCSRDMLEIIWNLL